MATSFRLQLAAQYSTVLATVRSQGYPAAFGALTVVATGDRGLADRQVLTGLIEEALADYHVAALAAAVAEAQR